MKLSIKCLREYFRRKAAKSSLNLVDGAQLIHHKPSYRTPQCFADASSVIMLFYCFAANIPKLTFCSKGFFLPETIKLEK